MAWRRWVGLSVLLVAGISGCGQNDTTSPTAQNGGKPANTADAQGAAVATSTDPTTAAKLDGPGKAVFEFLDAVRTGNDAKATAMLTTVAREKTAEMNRSVRPPASDTAKFQVGAVEYVGEDAARVATTWTDLDENGEPQTDEALWVLRRESEGWRVAGVAATIFEGEDPLLLDFENPEQMLEKQKWVREEIRRRAEAEQLQAKGPENAENSLRR